MDRNRIITIEELEVGDEIIASSNGHLRYYRVLRKPKINGKTGRWSGVKCSTNAQEKEFTRSAGTPWEKKYTKTYYFCTPEDHNVEQMIYGLSYRGMWLVKREGE